MLRIACCSLLLSLASLPALAAPPSLSEAAEWLRGYLRIDTSNPPGNEHRAVEYLSYLLQRERIPTQLLTSPRGVSAWSPGSRPAAGAPAASS